MSLSPAVPMSPPSGPWPPAVRVTRLKIVQEGGVCEGGPESVQQRCVTGGDEVPVVQSCGLVASWATASSVSFG